MRTNSWGQTRLSAAEFTERVTDLFVNSWRGRLMRADDETVNFDLGSRISFRVWGIWGPRSWSTRRIPLRIKLIYEERESEANWRLYIDSTEGPFYLPFPEFATRFFEGVFAEIEHDVGTALKR
ncbi:MAG: hypothetical protein ABI435_02345 [Pseudolysinimonas sp.]